jgi:signal transduction histidine kinase
MRKYYYQVGLKPHIKIPELGIRATIALIVATLGLVGYVQYSWFRKSTSAEMEDAYHALNATVLQTMSREFQRYAPLLGDLRAFASSDEPEASIPESVLRSALDREYKLYGPSGSDPRLLSSVGLVSTKDPSTTSILTPSGTWVRAPSPFALPIPEAARKQLEDGSLLVCGGGEPADKDRQFILAPLGPRSIAVVELDTEGFFQAYTKPAVAAVLPGAKIEWSTSLRGLSRQGNPPPFRRPPPRRAFNPFRALLGGLSSEDRSFAILVPATMDSFVMRGLGWFENWSPGPGGEGSYRPLQGGESPDPRAAIMMRMARIVVSPSSAVGSVERRLSLDWLLSTLLLLGLGLALIQAVIQRHRLATIRQREREFVASVTHELRTPVTAIRSAADNMRRGLVGQERMAAYGDMIHAQSLRLGSMIEEVLLFSQVEGGKAQAPLLVSIKPSDFAAELCPPLDAIARAEGVRIDWDFGSLPREFLGDAETLRLIVANLVANAVYHAYPGSEKGAVRVIGKTLLPEAIEFSVEDDGRGISRAEAGLVFDPFYRDEASRARHEKGSGLGLFIALRKARLLGGDIRLESPYPRIDGSRPSGCRFTLEFPFKEPDHVR